MKFLNDYFSILCFFITWVVTKSVYTATKAGIISSAVQLVFMALVYRKLKPLQWTALTFGFWAIFGGLTLKFHTPEFIQWKPSILYWCFGLAFLVSQYWSGDNLYKKMLKEKIELPDTIWDKLNISWVMFFIVMGALNVLVFMKFSMQTWIYYKIFGTIALTLVFAVVQAIYLNKYIEPQSNNPGEPKNNE